MSVADQPIEHITEYFNYDDMLVVATTAGRTLVADLNHLPVQLPPTEGARRLMADPSGKGLFIDGIPLTLMRLRLHCEPVLARMLQAEAEARSLQSA